MAAEIPPEIIRQLRAWNRLAETLRALHITLAVVATISSVLVAAKINTLDRTIIEWLAFAAAVSVGLMSAFDLGSKANRFRRAWRRLNAAVLRSQVNPGFSREELLKAYEEGEEIIGDVKELPE